MLSLSAGIVRLMGAGFYGSDVTPFLHDANIHHIELQHLQSCAVVLAVLNMSVFGGGLKILWTVINIYDQK